jgi:outer membrane protein assembly factor BamB
MAIHPRAYAAALMMTAAALACGGGSQPVSVGPSTTPPGPPSASVVQHHNNPTRDGLYVQTTLTRAAAATMQRDSTFAGTVQGNVYAQPLYVENGPGGKGTFYVVTESNTVHALDEATGNPVWTKTLGTPAPVTGAGCGNISPLGITGTPYIDLTRRTIYLDSVTGSGAGIDKHLIHALSIDDGAEVSGWPVDVSTVRSGSVAFDAVLENQRGALIAVGDMLYVPYGGHAGDCGDYRGWVVAVPLGNPGGARGWAVGARGGGIWALGGPSSDGASVFVATGNTFRAGVWAQGEAVVRLQPGATFSGQPADYFTPSNWRALDAGDVDLGGSGPVLIDVPGATPSALVVALGKAGVVHLLDRSNLGGLGKGDGITGEGVFSERVADREIINAAAAFSTASGSYVVFRAHAGARGVGCPSGQGGDLVSLRIVPGSPPTVVTAWCADNLGQGSPIVTTTDGRSEAIVWSAGAEGSERLHAWNAETGAPIFAGGSGSDLMGRVRRFTTPIAVKGRILVGGDNRLYAFKTH